MMYGQENINLFKMFLCFSNFSPSDKFLSTKFVLRFMIMFDTERYVSLLLGTADTGPHNPEMNSHRT
jgi:hypothetical protein